MDSPHCSCKLTRVRERHQRRVLRGRHLQRRPSVRAHPHSPCSKCRLSSIKMALITSNGCSYTKSASTIVILRWADGNWYISDLGDSRTPADGNDIDYFSEAHTPARPLAKQRQAASKQQASSKQAASSGKQEVNAAPAIALWPRPVVRHSLITASAQQHLKDRQAVLGLKQRLSVGTVSAYSCSHCLQLPVRARLSVHGQSSQSPVCRPFAVSASRADSPPATNWIIPEYTTAGHPGAAAYPGPTIDADKCDGDGENPQVGDGQRKR